MVSVMPGESTRREAFRRGLRDHGPIDLKAHPARKREGDVLSLAKRPVATMAPTTPIYDAIKMMVKEGFRRMPVAEPANKRLLGIFTATDIVDFLGGGTKFQLVQRKYNGNFFKAINEPIRSIMTQDVVYVYTTSTISQALEIMKNHNIGGLPVVDTDKRVQAILTERDIISFFAGILSGVKVLNVMSLKLVIATPNMSIYEAERTMVEKGFRRLPIVVDGKVIGMVTARTILQFFGSGEVFKHLRSGTMAQVLQTSILEAASKDVYLVSPDADVGEAAEIMRQKNVGSVLVSKDDKLVGIITERDFFKLIV
jgi:CBS domain-containing protein